MTSTAMIISGCVFGSGLALLARSLARPRPALNAALRRTPARATAGPTRTATQDEAAGRWLLEHLGDLPGVRIPTRDLALLGESPERFVLTKVALAALGLLAPVIAITPWLLLGTSVPFYLPGVFGLVAAALLFMAPDWQTRDRAKRAREEFAHAIAAYLDLVAHNAMAGDAPSQALQQAADVGRGWPFIRIRGALARARWEGIAPWQALVDLTRELELPVLEDLADIMRLSAHDGAAVYTNLRQRAWSLRTELLTAQAAEANADSEKMTAPGALLAVLVMLLIAFPAVVGILTT